MIKILINFHKKNKKKFNQVMKMKNQAILFKRNKYLLKILTNYLK